MSRSSLVKTLETHFLGSAPALNAVHHPSGWLIRNSGGYTKRGNSACPLDPTDPLNDAILGDIRSKLESKPNVIRITPLAQPSDDTFLDSQGWKRLDPSVVMLRELDTSSQSLSRPDIRVHTSSEPTSEWINGFASSSELSSSHTETLRSTLHLIKPPFYPIYLTLFDTANQAIAYGQAVMSGGIAGLYNIVVPTSCRGKGYGRAVTFALLEASQKAGARTAYLQVTEQNIVGKQLYRSLEFKDEYNYHYRIEPQALVFTG